MSTVINTTPETPETPETPKPKWLSKKKLLFGAIGAVAIIAIASSMAGGNDSELDAATTATDTNAAPAEPAPAAAAPAAPAPEPVAPAPAPEPVAPAPAPEPAAPEMTVAQQNAVDSAESYLDYAGFSRQSLIEQLEFEEFDTATATFAVDHVAPDWNAEAVESAKSYLEYTSFSRQGLIDQLLFEGFTPEQAEVGVVGAGY